MPRNKRYPGYLSPTSGDRIPKRWAVLAVDSEIDQESAARGKPELRLKRWRMLSGTPGKSWHEWPIIDQDSVAETMWLSLSALLSRRGTVACLCADVVQALTMLGAWERIDDGRLLLLRSPMILSDPPTAVKLAMPGSPGKLLLLDARNYGLDIPAGIEHINRLLVVAHGLPGMVSRLGMGSLQPTAGAQAMYGYRRSYLSVRPYLHCRERVLSLEQEALHGGRAECYRLGRVEGPIYELDFSGFYGSIMRHLRVPVMLRHWGDSWKPHGLRELEAGHGVIARVKVRTEWQHLPCKRDKITVWPVGTWWTVLCGGELLYAYGSGEVVDVAEWASYDLSPALSLYARRLLDYCYGAHKQPVADMRAIGKALLVSLPGKFAQTQRRWEDRPGAQPVHRWGTWHRADGPDSAHLYRSIAGSVQRQADGGLSPAAVPAIAAWIYAEGRQVLWGAQLIAGRDEVYYCHTDSLFVSTTGYWRLRDEDIVDDGVPGMLTLKDVHDWIDIRGISHYHTPTRNVCAGVVESAGGARGAGGTAYYLDTVGYALGESRQPLPILHPSAPEHSHPYLHGQVQGDGRVTPWRV